jgi:hypothetical protein
MGREDGGVIDLRSGEEREKLAVGRLEVGRWIVEILKRVSLLSAQRYREQQVATTP